MGNICSSLSNNVTNSVSREVNRASNNATSGVQQTANKATKQLVTNLGSSKIQKRMITDFDDFKRSWESEAHSPYDSIAYYVIAALNIPTNRALANAMMTVVVTKGDTVPSSTSPSGLSLTRNAVYFIDQLVKSDHIAKSYVGGTPTNDYRIDPMNLVMTVVKEQDNGGDGKRKIFIQSGGKDYPTPISVARNGAGQWKLMEYSSICTGVQKTKGEQGDF